MEIKIVGEVKFRNRAVKVYGDLDAPLFKAADVADLVEYGEGNVWNLVRLCEEDEHMLLPLVVAGQKLQVTLPRSSTSGITWPTTSTSMRSGAV